MTEQKLSKKLIAPYVFLALATLFSLIPTLAGVYLSLFTFVTAIILAYVFRAETDSPDELIHNHMTYIIRTMWIVGLFSLFTLAAASAYMIPHLDFSAMDSCTRAATETLNPENPDYQAANALMEPCMNDFIAGNKGTFTIAIAIGGGPLILYLLMRLFKGLSSAVKGSRIEKVKSWF